MSKDNKVNPGSYTQSGRLSQDDRAREDKKQREAASPNGDVHRGEHAKLPVTPKDKRPNEEQNDEE